MTEAELMTWGRTEHEARKADVAAAKAGCDVPFGLKVSQASAENRRKLAGLSMSASQRAVSAAARDARKST